MKNASCWKNKKSLEKVAMLNAMNIESAKKNSDENLNKEKTEGKISSLDLSSQFSSPLNEKPRKFIKSEQSKIAKNLAGKKMNFGVYQLNSQIIIEYDDETMDINNSGNRWTGSSQNYENYANSIQSYSPMPEIRENSEELIERYEKMYFTEMDNSRNKQNFIRYSIDSVNNPININRGSFV